MPPHPRLNWEFLAVARGRIAPYERDGDRGEPQEAMLWLFPPGVVHGWVGEKGKTCELIIAHYSTVPEAVAKLAMKRGRLATKLLPRDLAGLRRIAAVLKRHYWRPTVETDLQAQRALIDMCLLVLRDYQERRRQEVIGGSYSRVVAAEDWLRTHLSENPAIGGAAEAVGLSVSQLYRIFTRVRKESPQETLNRLKIERAMELLGRSNAKLERVALESGFTTASNLCRAFKAAKGRSPTAWRRETFIQYKIAPKSADPANPAEHGRRYRPVL